MLGVGLECRQISYSYGRASVLRDASVYAARGEVTCLLGPSGSGKTTLLNLIAGLLPMQGGEILLHGAYLATEKMNPPPEHRPVGVVFQDGALFPHMSVAQNVAYGLKGRASSDEVEQLLQQVDLGRLGKRFPHELSGGQQQRVALARSLAPQPDVLLLDEPFASLDVSLRQQLREMTRRILGERESVALMVTHDPEEALEIADHIVLFGEGAVLQAGPPAQLYLGPRSSDVASFVGGGSALDGRIEEALVQTAFGSWRCDQFMQCPQTDGPVSVVVRDGGLLAVADEASDLRVTNRVFRGATARLTIAAPDGASLSLIVPQSNDLNVGDRLHLDLSPGNAHAFTKS